MKKFSTRKEWISRIGPKCYKGLVLFFGLFFSVVFICQNLNFYKFMEILSHNAFFSLKILQNYFSIISKI